MRDTHPSSKGCTSEVGLKKNRGLIIIRSNTHHSLGHDNDLLAVRLSMKNRI